MEELGLQRSSSHPLSLVQLWTKYYGLDLEDIKEAFVGFELGVLAWICMRSLGYPGGGWRRGGSLEAERLMRTLQRVQQRDGDVQADGGGGEMKEGKSSVKAWFCWLGEGRGRGQDGEEAFQHGMLGFNPLDEAFPWSPF